MLALLSRHCLGLGCGLVGRCRLHHVAEPLLITACRDHWPLPPKGSLCGRKWQSVQAGACHRALESKGLLVRGWRKGPGPWHSWGLVAILLALEDQWCLCTQTEDNPYFWGCTFTANMHSLQPS